MIGLKPFEKPDLLIILITINITINNNIIIINILV